ncbi:AICAR transformylase/IMP cyclohydrolase PurH [Candidatus Methanoperedens nitroreducens]|uniref:AICAR transformylase/IMP cyclohydrolase PurH n=2 Tax=Candidatus Methanoperedens nitratireducens TaxID=1392998 RepID=A0A062V7A5_9EURY|nr:AICAR transformylase/IMP cyclohydrolase PurH [Candidatus Methanoperedens nitroreducens]
MMEGRVKTLHPKIHGAVLAARDNPLHINEASREGIDLIDIVAMNLYPFEEVAARENAALDEAIENIDIGGPALIRAAAKNYRHVAVITDPMDYPAIIKELEDGDISLHTRERLAVKAFRRIADYDCAIDRYLSSKLINEDILRLKFVECRTLRYGENWHQSAWFYKEPGVTEPSLANAKQLHGKALSYNNYVDAEGALNVVLELKNSNAVAVVKHNNPCGFATGKTLYEALSRAWDGDPVSSFGSIICMSQKPDLETLEFLKGRFVELIIAPGYDDDALVFLRNKSKDLRILEIPMDNGVQLKNTYRYIVGGLLMQSRNRGLYERWDVVSEHPFPDEKRGLAEFALTACKYTKSNAVVIAREYKKGFYQVLAMGAGQPNRVDSIRKLAATKAIENLKLLYEREKPDISEDEFIRSILNECVLASDAFFPFDDSIIYSAENHIRYIVSPGGSIRDKEVIATANRLGISLVFTGTRHFLH